MRVVLFGATGFIGGRVARRLVDAGHEVLAVVRDPARARDLLTQGVQVERGDLLDQGTYRGALVTADVIVNSAFPAFTGRSTMGRARRDARAGLMVVRNLLETVAEVASGTPVVLTEGTMGLGDSGSGWLDEESPHRFDMGHGRLLRYSVPWVEQFTAAHDLRVITLNISGAYGAGSWFQESLYELLKKGWLRVFGDGQNLVSVVHVDDVADAYRLAVEKQPIGETFLLADDEPGTFLDFANAVARAVGKPPVGRAPKWMGRLILGQVLLEALTMNQRVRNTKARDKLGWELRYPTQREGIPAALAEISAREARASRNS